MTAQQIATQEPDGTGDVDGAPDGPNPADPTVGAEGTENPSGEPLAIDPHNADWDREATRHLKAIRALETKEHRTRQAFDHEIEALLERRDMAVSAIKNKIAWHTAPLIGLHRALLALDPKNNKTIVLPYGKLTSSTPQKPVVRYPDGDAFVEWARTNAPDLVATKYAADRKAVAAAVGDRLLSVGTPKVGWSVDFVTADGEFVPGLILGLDDTTFSIHVDGEL